MRPIPDPVRELVDPLARRLDLVVSAPKLIDVINLMESNIETPLSLRVVAKQCNLSLRQMERLFLKYRKQTPSQFYLSVRLAHARQLLLNTNRRIIDISIATGFPSQSYFAACYRKHFGSSPRNYRSQAGNRP